MIKAQVWIETVIYTAMGLSLIAIVLSFITPKITEARDKILVEQGITAMNELDGKINAVISGGNGNIRNLDFTIKKGMLVINSASDKIIFAIEGLQSPYSEIGIPIKIGPLEVISQKTQRAYEVSLKLAYAANITYGGDDRTEDKKFNRASTPYRFFISNIENKIIDIKEASER